MTTEERFTKIENTLQMMADTQVMHHTAIQDLIRVSRTLLDSQKETTGQIQTLSGQMQTLSGQMQTLSGQMQTLSTQIQSLSIQTAETKDNLNALIQIVDEIIRKNRGNA